MTIAEKMHLIRKALHLSQEAFGKPLEVGGKQISAIEKDRVNPSQRVIELLFLKYLVNRNWWEDGIGEMFTAKQSQTNTGQVTLGFGSSLEDQLAWEEWKTLSPDQKLAAVQLLRKLKADH